nr:Predicted membrane protein [Streptococcus thermophilus]
MTPQPQEHAYRRIVALDVARGLAILGTLLTNIWLFAALAEDLLAGFVPGASIAGQAMDFARGTAQDDLRFDAWFVDSLLYLFTEGKFLGLLTIMFGVGVEIQRQNRLRRGMPWPGGYMWRAGVLVLEGLLNYIFIFDFDVLMGYGLTALAVAPILARSEKVQKAWMIAGLCVHALVVAVFTVWAVALNLMLKNVESDELAFDEFMSDYSTESYWGMVDYRVRDFIGGRWEVPIMFFMGVGVFIIGARLYRAGLFQPAGHRLRKKVMAIGFGVGLPLDWALRIFLTIYASPVARYVTSTVVAFGVLALIAGFYVRKDNALGGAGKPIAAVGRMALTCYILQNAIASIIFYDFGFGVARRIQGPYLTYWVLLIFLAIATGLILFSVLWLSKFSRGPMEMMMKRIYGPLAKRRDERILRKRRAAASTAPKSAGA